PVVVELGCFFFSSRRRHTSFSRDWSSDVCSSDLTFGEFGVLNSALRHDFGQVDDDGYHGIATFRGHHTSPGDGKSTSKTVRLIRSVSVMSVELQNSSSHAHFRDFTSTGEQGRLSPGWNGGGE